ncbi:MAG: cyclic nucleotide-binding domain-containing protein [Treponema sp.]|nr:cyclic nucleotide-binding domain-containing protein [Treponema sp.]
MPKSIQFGANALVYCTGDKADRIFLLQKGTIWLKYLDIETGEETSDVVEPGEFFGLKPVLGRFPREENALAKKAAVVLAFSLSEFELLLLSNDRIVMKMIKVFSGQLRRVHAHISSITKTQYVKPDYGLFEIGERYMKQGRHSQARYIFRRYLELYPGEENSEEAGDNLRTLGKSPGSDGPGNRPAGMAPPGESVIGDGVLQMDADFLAKFSRGFRPGEIIFSEFEPGNTFFLILSGDVKVVKNTGQYEKTLDVLRQPEIFGEMAILDKSPRTASAIAVNEVTLLEFTGENFEVLMRSHSQVSVKLLKVLAKRIHNAKRRAMILTLSDSHTKIADVFLMLDETMNASHDKTGDYSREFKIGVEDVAHWAGLNLVETKAVLDYYVTQRRISVYQNRMVVKNINDFSRLVASRRNYE